MTLNLSLPANMTTDQLLEQRGKTHGDFAVHARVTQKIKDAIYGDEDANSHLLSPIQRESVDMIAHKLGRIAAGDPNHKDHWDDIAGYARLVSQRLD